MPDLAVAALSIFKTVGSALLGTGGGAAASSGSLLSGSTFLTGLKILGTIGAGVSANNQAKDAAAETELEADRVRNESENRAAQRKRELLAVLGENKVAFAAAGVDASSGLAASSEAAAKKRVEEDLSIERADSDFRRQMLMRRAASQRRQGRGALGGALIGALGQGVSAGLGAGRIDGPGSDPWRGLR